MDKLIEAKQNSINLSEKIIEAINEWSQQTNIDKEQIFATLMATLQCLMIDFLIDNEICEDDKSAIKEIIDSFKRIYKAVK